MKIAMFGSSLVSAYWNGAATYYRGILRALARRGHAITFYEPDAYDRQKHRDIEDPSWARVVVYPANPDAALRVVDEARSADLIVKASGVGVFDELLEEAVLSARRPGALAAFWDVDAPATLARMEANPDDALRKLVPRYDHVLLYGGGPPAVQRYLKLGARRCAPIYNAADPETHHPVARDPRFVAHLAFLGNRLPDREQRVESFLLGPASRLPDHRFLLGGSGWESKELPANVRHIGHVYTRDHNAFNVTPRAVLNIARDSMVECGYSPATRVFEAASAAACVVTDDWAGIEQFFEPESEILVARNGDEIARHVLELMPDRARAIGARARRRVLAEHRYEHRALDFERAFGVSPTQITSSRPSARAVRPRASMHVVVLGLSITSSWGNGHAVTYRSLIRELCARGHDVLFLERDVPWYAQHRDMPCPPYGRTELYASLSDLRARFGHEIEEADLVIVGSCVPDGVEVGGYVLDHARGLRAFYDIDTPWTLAQLGAGACPYLSAEQVPAYDLYLSFAGGPTLARLEEELGSPCARALYCTADPLAYGPEATGIDADLGYMGTYSIDRQPAIEQLMFDPARRMPEQRFVVAGAQYPQTVAWPRNVRHFEHVAPSEHRTFYNRTRFTLNVTRRDMITAGYAPSVRLFEAAACGVPILSDGWAGLDEFFEPNAEILIVNETLDVIRAMREMTDAERQALGRRARDRFLDEHTPAHRARDLEYWVEHARSAKWAREPAVSSA